MRLITIACARTGHYRKMRRCGEPCSGSATLSPSLSWPGYIISTSGYDFRKGQRRDPLVTLITRQKLPAIYPYRYYTASGGLFSYGPDTVDQYRRAAGYVDRILKGEKPADLPVQASTKYELVINLKTAKALGITVPQALLAQANEVIE